MTCFCGCGRAAVARHHAITRQAIRQATPRDGNKQSLLVKDERNLVPVAMSCHAEHHSKQWPFPKSLLPASVYEFAVEVLKPGPAYEYIRRHYSGDDPRHSELLVIERADGLRTLHLVANGVEGALPWHRLQDSEQQRWLEAAA